MILSRELCVPRNRGGAIFSTLHPERRNVVLEWQRGFDDFVPIAVIGLAERDELLRKRRAILDSERTYRTRRVVRAFREHILREAWMPLVEAVEIFRSGPDFVQGGLDLDALHHAQRLQGSAPTAPGRGQCHYSQHYCSNVHAY